MFRDKDGWRVQWRAKGRRLSRKFKSRTEAEDFVAKRRLGLADERPSERGSPTFEDFANRWLAEYSRAEKRATSHAEDKRVVKRHLVPALGPKRIKDLRRADLVELKANLLVKTAKDRKTALGPKTVNNILMVAKSILGYAAELELIGENPWRRMKPCKVAQRDFDFWRPEERDEFYARTRLVREDLGDLAYFACHTGLRRGELAALTWTAVDLERRKVRVVASYNVGLKALSPTKGGEVADVPLNSAALAVLRERAEDRDGPMVFPTELFENLRRAFTALCRRVGVRPIRFHDTRHTFASTLAMAGVDLLVIQQLMRHKSYQMTLRYAHLLPSHLAGQTEVLVTGTQTARSGSRDGEGGRNPAVLKRTRSDSNARPSGSKNEAVEILHKQVVN